MSRKRLTQLAFSFFLVLILGSGCSTFTKQAECYGPSAIEISWLFEGEDGCPTDASKMYVQLRDATAANVHTAEDGDEFACSAMSAKFPSLVCGGYEYRVRAKNADGTWTWDTGWVPGQKFNGTGGLIVRTANLRRAPQ